MLSGLRIESHLLDAVRLHPIVSSNHKHRRVSYSCFIAEILAATAAHDRGYDIKMSISSIFPDLPLRNELLVDSKSLFETISILNQHDDCRLQGKVFGMRDSFELKELNYLR